MVFCVLVTGRLVEASFVLDIGLFFCPLSFLGTLNIHQVCTLNGATIWTKMPEIGPQSLRESTAVTTEHPKCLLFSLNLSALQHKDGTAPPAGRFPVGLREEIGERVKEELAPYLPSDNDLRLMMSILPCPCLITAVERNQASAVEFVPRTNPDPRSWFIHKNTSVTVGDKRGQKRVKTNAEEIPVIVNMEGGSLGWHVHVILLVYTNEAAELYSLTPQQIAAQVGLHHRYESTPCQISEVYVSKHEDARCGVGYVLNGDRTTKEVDSHLLFHPEATKANQLRSRASLVLPLPRVFGEVCFFSLWF